MYEGSQKEVRIEDRKRVGIRVIWESQRQFQLFLKCVPGQTGKFFFGQREYNFVMLSLCAEGTLHLTTFSLVCIEMNY